jgi:hypothetical protein
VYSEYLEVEEQEVLITCESDGYYYGYRIGDITSTGR